MAWFERLPRAVQGWLALGGILVGLLGGAFALGARSSVLIVEQRGLPARVTVVEADVEKMKADMVETRCYVRAFALQRNPLTDCAAMLNEPVR